MMIVVGVHVMMNDLEFYGHLLGSSYALDIITLLHHKPARRIDVAKMLGATNKKQINRIGYYLRRMLSSGLVQKHRSVHTHEEVVGLYSLTHQGEKVYKMAVDCGAEINLLNSKINFTDQTKFIKGA